MLCTNLRERANKRFTTTWKDEIIDPWQILCLSIKICTVVNMFCSIFCNVIVVQWSLYTNSVLRFHILGILSNFDLCRSYNNLDFPNQKIDVFLIKATDKRESWTWSLIYSILSAVFPILSLQLLTRHKIWDVRNLKFFACITLARYPIRQYLFPDNQKHNKQ